MAGRALGRGGGPVCAGARAFERLGPLRAGGPIFNRTPTISFNVSAFSEALDRDLELEDDLRRFDAELEALALEPEDDDRDNRERTSQSTAMPIELAIIELSPPRLQFGGASTHSDPKSGFLAAGPFDLRFGSARKDHVHIGIVGPAQQVEAARRWLDRCGREVPVFGEPNLLKKPFPGFAEAFHKSLVAPNSSAISLTSDTHDELAHALEGDAYGVSNVWLTYTRRRTRGLPRAT